MVNHHKEKGRYNRMCTVYGYCRISTGKQKLERQIANIRQEAPEAVIIAEAFTGTTCSRPKWSSLFKTVKAGDTIIFDEVSRMSRNAAEGFEAYKALYDRGVNLIFLKERHINTDVYRDTLKTGVKMTGTDVDCILQGVNEYLMILARKQIEVAFEQAQAEVDHLHKRTSEGVRRAQAEGKQVGRKAGAIVETKKAQAVKEIIRKHSQDFGGSLSDQDVIKLAGCARGSYYKYKAQLRNE